MPDWFDQNKPQTDWFGQNAPSNAPGIPRPKLPYGLGPEDKGNLGDLGPQMRGPAESGPLAINAATPSETINTAKNVAPVALSMLGSMGTSGIPAVLGAAAGGGIGGAIQHSSEGPGGMIGGALENGLSMGGLEGVGQLAQLGIKGVASKLFTKYSDAGRTQALQQLPEDYPGVSVSQATNSPAANVLEQLGASKDKAALIQKQKTYVNKIGSGLLKNDPELIVQQASDQVKQNSPGFIDSYTNAVKNGKTADFEQYQDGLIDKSNKADSKVAQQLLAHGVDPDMTYRTIMNNALGSVEQARNFINATGDRESLSQLALRKIGETGTDVTSREFSASKALNELADPSKQDIYKTALGSQGYSNAKRLFNSLSAVEESPTNVHPYMQYGFMVKAGHMALSVGPALLGALTEGHTGAMTGLGSSAMLLGVEKYLGKTLTNPTVARAMYEGTKMPVTAPASTVTSRIVLQGLKGATGLMLQTNDGHQVPVQIDSRGQIQPETK
jgi:hypothetical protein